LIFPSSAASVCWLESVENVSVSRLESLVANVCSSVRMVPRVASVFVVVVCASSDVAYWLATVAWVLESSEE